MASRLVLMAMLLSIALATTGCATTGSTATPGVSKADIRKARCAGWQSITYSASKDTRETTGQVRKHNATGEKKGCW